MWLQSELSPYFADGRLTHSEFFGQSITTPMRRAVARTASRQFQDPRLGRRTTSPVLVTTVARSQANQTLLNEALLPNANVSISATQSTTNLTVGMPSGQEQNQFCSFHQLRRQRSAPCTALQLPAFRRSQYQPIPIHALNLSEMLYESRTYCTSMGVGSVFGAVFVISWLRARFSPDSVTLSANLLIVLAYLLMALVRRAE